MTTLCFEVFIADIEKKWSRKKEEGEDEWSSLGSLILCFFYLG